MKRRSVLPIVITASATVILGVCPVSAVNVLWTNAGSGLWTDAGNWGGSLPGSADVGQINNGGTATIDSSMTLSTSGVQLGTATGGSGNLQITGGSLSTVGDLRIGGNGSD